MKAILVIDIPTNDINDCYAEYEIIKPIGDCGYTLCGTDYTELKPMPEKKLTDIFNYGGLAEQYRREGWNDCIEEILKEEKTKAVLVLDMPKKCSECQLSNSGTGPSDDWSCDGVQEKIETITGEHLVNKKIKLENINKIQSWCPLKHTPQKKTKLKGRGKDSCEYSLLEQLEYRRGFNDCLDEILGDE